MDQLSTQLMQAKEESNSWKQKWAAESTKTDGIKKECLQVRTEMGSVTDGQHT